MSLVEKVADVDNAFLARREITCNFGGLGGKLTRLDAVDIVTKEYGLDGKVVVPMRLQSQVGRTVVTGMFYVYGDEAAARSHVGSSVFGRLEKARKQRAEKEQAAKGGGGEAGQKGEEGGES